ncbi:MAG: YCF48-related protein [Ignavibacteriaceae bacterium]|nr:YCF48-related protein [Ignavibacteriaceae bacterium]
MKKFILFFVLSLSLNLIITAQTWRQAYNMPIYSTSNGVFSDQNTAWLVGSKQSIYKSTDGGSTWTTKFRIDTSSYLAKDVCFITSTTGFVGCNHGKILKTTDGGDTWQSIFVPDTSTTNTRIHFFDANLGFTLSTYYSQTLNKYWAFIYKTSDGGATWTRLDSIGANMYAMDFSSPTTGIVTGNNGNIWYTTDGTTWNIKSSLTLHPPTGVVYSRLDQWAVKFISASTAVSCGWGSSAVGFEPTIFLKTTDGGANWNQMVQADANKTYVNFNSIYFKDQLNGISTGGSTYPGTVICRTTDGGITWIPLPTFSGFDGQVVSGFNDKVVISSGSGDVIISSDFGNSWSIANKYPTTSPSAIQIINNNIYACCYGSSFFKSTNAGDSFDMSYMLAANKCLWSKDLFFLNENLGYAVSQRGQALKTTNGGVSWIQIIRDTLSSTIGNQGVYFLNENLGFVVGNYGSNIDIIYKTTDGGGTWSSQTKNAFQTLNCVSFADQMHGAAGGNKSTILYTTDQGVSWNVATVNTTDQLAINRINFYDGLNGIAVGEKIILKTTDGGATWNRIIIPIYAQNSSLYGVCHDLNGIYVAGGKYCLKSTDTGNTWVNIMDTVFAVQNDITEMKCIDIDKSGNLWIGCGGSGAGIITNSPLDGIINTQAELSSFKLEQNYPNPFNPSTSINFTINKQGYITLKLFDILGRVVREIYKGEITAGQHKINFNAGNLASGTYIYTLQVNDQVTSRKMMLLK